MSSDPAPTRLPSEALDAFLDGILAELRSPADSAALDEVRAAFRRRVPFSLRSYAAAAMILRAAGLSRGLPKPPTVKESAQKGAKPGRDAAGSKKPEPRKDYPRDKANGGAKEAPKSRAAPERTEPSQRPRYAGEGTTLFFSMGKRQRLYPRSLIDLLVEDAGLALAEIGDVRSFDNYTFADVDPSRADAVVAALDGKEVRGKKISVNLAKKRDGEAVAD